MPPYAPKYVDPKQAAQDKARVRAWIFGIVIGFPLLFAFLLYGYSDQAPAALRDAITDLDRQLGYPILWLISTLAPR
jgi:hypothetical protein